MPALLLTLAAVFFAGAVGFVADPAEDTEPDNTQYALETFPAKSEKLDVLHAWFRADPDWLMAKKASEEKAGDSLTNPKGGVVSEFLIPTDYSPLQ